MTAHDYVNKGGNLYQLVSPYQLSHGSLVLVNGPYDKYGIVLSSKKKEGSLTGEYVNLIRGKGRYKPTEFANKAPSFKF